MASLDSIGMQGWQMLVGRSLELAHRLHRRLNQLELLQGAESGFVRTGRQLVGVAQRPKCQRHLSGIAGRKLDEHDLQRYSGEIKRMYEKREKFLNPTIDARLGFTTNFGFKPHGHEVPAWKPSSSIRKPVTRLSIAC